MLQVAQQHCWTCPTISMAAAPQHKTIHNPIKNQTAPAPSHHTTACFCSVGTARGPDAACLELTACHNHGAHCAALQVGMKMSFQGSQGQLTFFLGNKSSSALQRLILVVPPQPQFLFQLGQVPPLLEAKKQIQVSGSMPDPCNQQQVDARLWVWHCSMTMQGNCGMHETFRLASPWFRCACASWAMFSGYHKCRMGCTSPLPVLCTEISPLH